MSNTQRFGSYFGLGLIMLLLGCKGEQPSVTSNPTTTKTPSALPTIKVTKLPTRSPSSLTPAQPPQAAKSPKTTTSAPVTTPESFIGEGTLTAKDSKAQINLRSTASATSKLLGYGVVGDSVKIIAQKETEGYTWNLVRFPKSDTKAWVRGDYIKTAKQNTAKTPLPTTSPQPAAGSQLRKAIAGGNCECPYDIALRAYIRTVHESCIYAFSYSFKFFQPLFHPCF